MTVSATNQMEVIYVGNVTPDTEEYWNSAFSRAGNTCQLSLLQGLMCAGVVCPRILSSQPMASFPRSRQVWVRGAKVTGEGGLEIQLLPSVNVTPLKQLTIGLSTFFFILGWGWHTRHARKRVVYTYNISVPPGLFTLLAAWFTRSKCIAMVYDIFVPGETAPATALYKLDYWLHRKLLPRFDGIVAITDAIAQDFAPGLPSILVEGGVSEDLAARSASMKQSRMDPSSKSSFILVVAGRLDETNGIPIILDAFAKLPGDGYRLEIAGSGPLEDRVREAARQDERITFHGFVSFNEILKIYGRAGVLINMRLTKTLNTKYFFPSKVLEYLTSGVPVITTCPAQISHEYSDMAYLLEEETSSGLAEMVIRVASTEGKDRELRAARAQDYMIRNKTWNAQGRRIASFIDQLFDVAPSVVAQK